MAKKTMGIIFKNVTIDTSDMTFTEVSKDDVQVHDIMTLLNEYNGVEGLTISFKQDCDTVFEVNEDK